MTKYEVMNVLPKWAYHEEEWRDIMIECDKIVDGIMYKLVEVKEPEPEANIIVELMNM